MRAVRRFLHRHDELRQRLPADARDKNALDDAMRLMLWRAYVALLQGLCEAYRIRPAEGAEPASEQTWLQALAEFNPQMAELQRIEQARDDRNHWLYPLRYWWKHYWMEEPAAASGPGPALINTDTAGDWVDDARAGLAEWAEDLAQNSQTN